MCLLCPLNISAFRYVPVVIISFFVSGSDYEILPLKIYSMVRLGVKPEINALCTIMFSFTLVMVLFAQFLIKEKN